MTAGSPVTFVAQNFYLCQVGTLIGSHVEFMQYARVVKKAVSAAKHSGGVGADIELPPMDSIGVHESGALAIALLHAYPQTGSYQLKP